MLDYLAPELVKRITDCLDVESVGRLASTCKYLYLCTTGDPYILNLVRARLGLVGCALRNWADTVAFATRCPAVSVWEVNRALEVAVRNGCTETVALLLTDSRVDNAREYNNLFRLAAWHGHVEILRLLLADKRSGVLVLGKAGVETAARNGHVDVVRTLLADPRVDLAATGSRAMEVAARLGHAPMVALLLTVLPVESSEIIRRGMTCAALWGRTGVMRALLADPRTDPSVQNYLVVWWAAQSGKDELLELLLADPRVHLTGLQIFKYRRQLQMARYGDADVRRFVLAAFLMQILAVAYIVGHVYVNRME